MASAEEIAEAFERLDGLDFEAAMHRFIERMLLLEGLERNISYGPHGSEGIDRESEHEEIRPDRSERK